MSKINNSDINDAFNSIHDAEANILKIKEHEYIYPTSLLTSRPDTNQLIKNYFLGNKEVNKIKNLDPYRKIIDATDIDWTGFNVSFEDKIFTPQTTFELLDIIFRLINGLYSLHGDVDVVWNDNGERRTSNNTLDWAGVYADVNDSTDKFWEE